MPIYEYIPVDPESGCSLCMHGFEQFQKLSDQPITNCPACRAHVKKTVSLCRAAIIETSAESASVEKQLKSYEKQGLHSHAAELADTHSEKTNDSRLKSRANENYKKAGYDVSD
ncbi:MAG: zinc ribbon domain-containing protein [Deltaproteobacteria bacterium]|jgi:putative FmdB family regulatory protein|nr:zinc ribbon domain-containing protein [Deltaproteobacteria bacterium]MBT4640457.1 zinc ribbon domain-containing protein [Deltaproteobacteria bacterium]MBT6502915.1 zinc ribbon domain-containing protein [Deltaproteobacteria bacterium]MBT6615969.1 zinc ribbon domain-containing protein [Deltaproteobacteria bacterium]MBT7154418.1 zinc ribbon domain-containing protein [Deltaproteobacteria bacterium]